MFDLIIIGAGPAGITAGIYAARKKLKTLLITEDFLGQVSKAFLIENWPGEPGIVGLDLIKKFKEHLNKFEIETKQGEKISRVLKSEKIFEVKTKEGNLYQAKAVIVATGRDPRPLEVPGEKEFLGRGVGYCVVCDGPLFEGKTVAVIGGGNSGFEAALDLIKYCPKIYLLHHQNKPAADELAQERVKKESKIKLVLNAKTREIKGQDFVESLVYEDKTSGEQKELPLQGVFIQIGLIPATGFVKDLVDFNQWDEIVVDLATGATKTPGLFAAGDATQNPIKQIVVAAADGCKAALSAYQYLQEDESNQSN